MRGSIVFAIVTFMSTLVVAQTLPASQAVTDPKLITSKQDLKVERNLSIEKLYMTRSVGGADWSPDGKQLVFVSNLSGRNNLSWEKKLALDVWYVDHRSLLLDLKILARTIGTVISAEGINAPSYVNAHEFKGSGK